MRNAAFVASALAMALSVTTACTTEKTMEQTTTQAQETEQCFGVAKAGKNDCKAGTHACAGQSTANADPQSFVAMPKGTCEKIVGGSLQPTG